MFWLIKWAFYSAVIVFFLFSYDFYRHLSGNESQQLKNQLKYCLDSGENSSFVSTLYHRMSEDFHQRFYPKIKKAVDYIKDDAPLN